MKKPLLLIASILIALNLLAQRDIQVKLLRPVPADSLVNKQPFKIDARLINKGTDIITTSDSLYVSYYLNSFKILVGPGIPYTVLKFSPVNLNPGDSIDIDFASTSLTFQRINGYETFCLGVVIPGEVEAQMTNNAGCVTLRSMWRTSNKEEILNHSGLSIYPVPFDSKLSIKNTYQQDGKIYITDVLGKLIYQGEINALETTNISTENWVENIYFITIFTTDGKLMHQQKICK